MSVLQGITHDFMVTDDTFHGSWIAYGCVRSFFSDLHQDMIQVLSSSEERKKKKKKERKKIENVLMLFP